MENLKFIFSETNKNIHIMGLTETHANSTITDSEFNIDGYTVIRKDRSTGIGGGVLCYIRSDLNWKRRLDLETDEIESICIEFLPEKSSSIIIMIMYKPPDSSLHLHQNFTDALKKYFNKL